MPIGALAYLGTYSNHPIDAVATGDEPTAPSEVPSHDDIYHRHLRGYHHWRGLCIRLRRVRWR